jgi:hypothetical protein
MITIAMIATLNLNKLPNNVYIYIGRERERERPRENLHVSLLIQPVNLRTPNLKSALQRENNSLTIIISYYKALMHVLGTSYNDKLLIIFF